MAASFVADAEGAQREGHQFGHHRLALQLFGERPDQHFTDRADQGGGGGARILRRQFTIGDAVGDRGGVGLGEGPPETQSFDIDSGVHRFGQQHIGEFRVLERAPGESLDGGGDPVARGATLPAAPAAATASTSRVTTSRKTAVTSSAFPVNAL